MSEPGSLHVVVTGGSRGLGLDLVRRLLAEGYCVSTCSRSSSPELEALLNDPSAAGRIHWQVASMEDREALEQFFHQLPDRFRGAQLYGLVNNAAIAQDGVLATFPMADVERILAVNLTGSIAATRLFLRHLVRARQPGRIVNISSVIGSRGYTGLAAYSASKAGLDGFTRSVAREVGRMGITVNSVAPGYLDTEMTTRLDERQRRQIVSRTPLGRLGTTADVVPLVAFLLSEEARFMTGQTLVVDGGISC